MTTIKEKMIIICLLYKCNDWWPLVGTSTTLVVLCQVHIGYKRHGAVQLAYCTNKSVCFAGDTSTCDWSAQGLSRTPIAPFVWLFSYELISEHPRVSWLPAWYRGGYDSQADTTGS